MENGYNYWMTTIDEFKAMALHYLNLPIEDKQKHDGVLLPWDVRKGIKVVTSLAELKIPTCTIYSASTPIWTLYPGFN